MTVNRRQFIQFTAAGAAASYISVKGIDALISPTWASLEKELNQAITDLPAATISAAVIRQGQVVWEKNFGYHNISKNQPIMDDSAWQTIGSISKLMVWTAVMQWVERGVLNLDQDISDYLGFSLRSPYFPDAKITLTHLMTHCSSIASRRLISAPDTMADAFCHRGDEALAQWVHRHFDSSHSDYQGKEVFANYRAGDHDQVPPDLFGVFNGYANSHAVLAAYIVERVAQQPFAQYCHEHIFVPCGMTETAWDKDRPLNWMTHYETTRPPKFGFLTAYTQALIDRGYSSGQRITAHNGEHYIDFSQCDYDSAVYPMGLLGTSLRSFLPFMLAFVNQGKINGYQLLHTSTIETIFQPRRLNQQGSYALGLGWFGQITAEQGLIWGHEGGAPGALTSMRVDPKTGCGWLLFINNFIVDEWHRQGLLKTLQSLAYQSNG